MENIKNSEAIKVKLISEESEKIMKELKIETFNTNNNVVEFLFKENINELLQTLSKYKLTRLWLEEPDIEEVFMHYYK